MREKLIELLTEYYGVDPAYYGIEAQHLADHLIANGVTIPVRCKDCRYYDDTEGLQWCHLNSKFGKFAMEWHSFPEDGFCSYGERKGDGNG